jgi:hypothetical protein
MNLFTQATSASRLNSFPAKVAGGAACRVLISIPTGFQLRQFVHSGVLDLLLRRGVQALIVSPNRKGEGFAAELNGHDVDVHVLDLDKRKPLRWRYLLAREHLLCDGSPTNTLRRKIVSFRQRHFWLALGAQLGNGLLRLSPWLRQRVLRWECFILRDRDLEALLAAQPVDLILLGSPGYTEQDALLLHAAVRHGIPVAVAIMSWDNLSSKGLINPQPDCLLVWSDHMRREAIDLQRMPAERIVETGAPLYDRFANPGRFGSRSENLRRLGLDPTRRLILYGTNHAGFFPDEVEVVKRVAQWVEEGSLGAPCQLWVRLHPQAVVGPYRLEAEPYHSLVSERVRVEFPPVRNSTMPWDLPEHDLDHLVGLLRDADVVINTASTLSIDAAILDRPVVCVAYDPTGDLPFHKSVRSYYDYTHMANVVQACAAQFARSPDEMHQKIVAYLNNPAQDREGRRRIVDQQFGRVDGRSAERLVDQILHMALTSNGNSRSSH